MAKAAIAIVMIVVILLVISACGREVVQEPAPAQVYHKITAKEAKTIMDSEEVIVLDVRSPEEYKEGHIKNAILLPYTSIEAKAATVLPDKNAKILVYCKSGNRSAIASKYLVDLGYTQIYNFGGIVEWPYEIVK